MFASDLSRATSSLQEFCEALTWRLKSQDIAEESIGSVAYPNRIDKEAEQALTEIVKHLETSAKMTRSVELFYNGDLTSRELYNRWYELIHALQISALTPPAL